MLFNTNKEKENASLGITIRYYFPNGYDELFILSEKLEMYILPIEEIKNKSTLNICDKYHKYRVN